MRMCTWNGLEKEVGKLFLRNDLGAQRLSKSTVCSFLVHNSVSHIGPCYRIVSGKSASHSKSLQSSETAEGNIHSEN